MKTACAWLVLGMLAAASPAGADPSLELTLSAPPEGFQLGEPVVVHVVLRNAGGEPATVMQHLEPEYGAVVYSIAREGAPLEPFSPWALKDLADPRATLARGEGVEGDAELFHDGKDWVFKSPGSYRIQARYLEGVTSNELAVQVREPTDAAARGAADLLVASPEAGLFILLRGGDHLEQGVRTLDKVVA